jgi:hypothetical protein
MVLKKFALLAIFGVHEDSSWNLNLYIAKFAGYFIDDRNIK